jgi:hypothetical protein
LLADKANLALRRQQLLVAVAVPRAASNSTPVTRARFEKWLM